MELADHAAIVLVQTLGKLGEARDEPVIVGTEVDATTYWWFPVDAGYIDGTDTALGHAFVQINARAAIGGTVEIPPPR